MLYWRMLMQYWRIALFVLGNAEFVSLDLDFEWLQEAVAFLYKGLSSLYVY
jgi:hypothetical protein